MKNIRVFLPENFQFLEVKFSIYLNKRVFVMVFGIGTAVYIFYFPWFYYVDYDAIKV